MGYSEDIERNDILKRLADALDRAYPPALSGPDDFHVNDAMRKAGGHEMANHVGRPLAPSDHEAIAERMFRAMWDARPK